MNKFERQQGLVAPLDRANVDTDLIIPKQFLKSIKRTGFGVNLFDALRYLDEGYPGQDVSQRVRSIRISCSTSRATRAPACCWPGATLAAAAHASTRPGRLRISAFAWSSRRASPTSSTTMPSRTAFCW